MNALISLGCEDPSGGGATRKNRISLVLGTGINFCQPPENKELFCKISENGAVITQFPFNRPGDKQSFPIRNRIIAGMTLGTVVVEANMTSGSLITANFAAEYGRQVFAVPGRIDSPRSKGCHDLIKKGAKLCEGAEDILSEIEYLFPASNRPDSAFETGTLPALTLSANEQAVYDALTKEESAIYPSPTFATGGVEGAQVIENRGWDQKSLPQGLLG